MLATAVKPPPVFKSYGLTFPGLAYGPVALASGEAAAHQHRPVLPEETLRFLALKAGGIYVDGTLGEGGHAQSILDASAPDGVVLGIDRDPRSLAVAARRLRDYGQRARLAHGNYAEMTRIAVENGITAADGILLDLGFSSRQVDSPGYGFSFQRDEPLDMRYDPEGATAADMVNSLSERELADVIFQNAEERRSRAIARAIVNARPVNTTGQLADLVTRAVGGRRTGQHPATRTFQALRIAVNRELEHLATGLDQAQELLGIGGRLVVISYHSLEDRLVKGWMDHVSATCRCPPGLPVCVCEHTPTLRLVQRRIVRPTVSEREANPRSRSARLRVAERL